MSPFRVIAVETVMAEGVRATGLAPRYGHPVHVETARGYGPCRHCLRTFVVNEERRILFTHDAFNGIEALPLPGPVFIHEGPCERYPEDGGIPSDLLDLQLTLNAYGRGRHLIAQEYVPGTRAEPAVTRLLQRDDVDYVHVRNTGAGCYMFRIERPLPRAGDARQAGAGH